MSAPRAVVVMGPAGAGKSTVGAALARTLRWRFVEADDFHSEQNRQRLSRGESLSDADRAPWLRALAAEIARALHGRESLVVACSALKQNYRAALLPAGADEDAVQFVFLKVSRGELARRLQTRAGHFAPPSLLDGQLATLEEPTPEEHGAVTVDGEQPPERVVDSIRGALAL